MLTTESLRYSKIHQKSMPDFRPPELISKPFQLGERELLNTRVTLIQRGSFEIVYDPDVIVQLDTNIYFQLGGPRNPRSIIIIFCKFLFSKLRVST